MKNSSQPSRREPAERNLLGLDWLNFFLADVQTGVGPFLAVYLAGFHWNEQSVGIALTIGSIAGITFQTPAGALVDRVRWKRALIAGGIAALAAGSALLAFCPTLVPVIAAQIIIGGSSSVFIPAIAAISLGIVGRRLFDARTGRNQMFNSAGNVFTALSVGSLAWFFSNRSIFFFVIVLCVPAILSLTLINPDAIDHDLARGCATAKSKGAGKAGPARLRELLKNRPLLVFCIAAVMFHFANAAMLPLLGEMLARGHDRASAFFMAACVTTTQLTIVCIATLTGKLAGRWGRKPLLLVGFGVLPVRGILYTIVHGPVPLIAIQVLDGVGAGIFGVLSILVVADLTRGTGRFNLAQGALATAVGIGASLSQTVAGAIVHHFGYPAGFLSLAGVAAAAFAILLVFMPETGRVGRRRTGFLHLGLPLLKQE